MTSDMAETDRREQARETVNTLRFLGGMLLIAALLLYFFHLGEAPLGQSLMGLLAGAFAVVGVGLLWVGHRKLRALR